MEQEKTSDNEMIATIPLRGSVETEYDAHGNLKIKRHGSARD